MTKASAIDDRRKSTLTSSTGHINQRVSRRETRQPKSDDQMRARMERAIERLINALDALDAPDEELEETDPLEGPDPDVEPDNGSINPYASSSQALWSGGVTDDRERDAGDEGEPDIDEPSLGSFDRMIDQRKSWRQHEPCGAYVDYEVEQGDREPDTDAEPDSDDEDGGDREPSLAAPEAHESHGIWCKGDGLDCEVDQVENVIAEIKPAA